jgi:hypothetical protein
LYPHCKGYSQNQEYEKAKVVLKGSSVELYNSDLPQTLKGPGQVVAQGWLRYSVLGYQDLISASQCIEVLIADS